MRLKSRRAAHMSKEDQQWLWEITCSVHCWAVAQMQQFRTIVLARGTQIQFPLLRLYQGASLRTEDANTKEIVMVHGTFGKRPFLADNHKGRVMTTDDEVGRQILGIFMRHRVPVNGVLRRNHFMEVRDADFQRGLSKAVENHWIRMGRDRYSYELTDAGLVAGTSSAHSS